MTGKNWWGIVILNYVSYVVYRHLRRFVFYMLGVMNLHPANSGPEILLLLLKALISISAPLSPHLSFEILLNTLSISVLRIYTT